MDRKIARRAFICQATAALGAASLLPAEARPITINGVPLIYEDTLGVTSEDLVKALAGAAALEHATKYHDLFRDLCGPIWPFNPGKRMWCLTFSLADTVLTYHVHFSTRDYEPNASDDSFVAHMVKVCNEKRQALIDSLTTPDKAFA